MAARDDLAARRSATQHGLISSEQALQLGFSRSAIQHRRASGRWITFAPGVYLMHGAPVTWHTRLLATCLSVSGVASHRSAAVLHDIAGIRKGAPEVTVPRRCGVSRTDALVHESTDLYLSSVVHIDGIPTTGAERLFVDLAAVLPYHWYESAVDDIIGRGLASWDAALDVMFSHSEHGRTGMGALRVLLTERYGDQVPTSMLERAFVRQYKLRGRTPPIAQHEIFDERGFVARVDFAFPDVRLAIELDSRRWHLNAVAFEEDRRKRNRLKAAGWVVLEYTWEMVINQSEMVLAQIDETRTSLRTRAS
jgi:hypothetical protein